MRKYLIILVIVIFSIILLLALKNGYQIGNMKILSIAQIKESKEQLDDKIEEMTVLTTSTYESKLSDLSNQTKAMLLKKADYNDLVTFSSEDEVKAANQTQTYKIEYLWTKVGNHATKNGVTIKMDVVNGTNGSNNAYDLNFSITGQYIPISDFIFDLEDDATLGFKIEDFTLTPSSGNTLSASFTVKNINIDLDKNNLVSSDSNTQGTNGSASNSGATGTNSENNTNTATSQSGSTSGTKATASTVSQQSSSTAKAAPADGVSSGAMPSAK